MGKHGAVYMTTVGAMSFYRPVVNDSGPEARRLIQAPTQNSKTKMNTACRKTLSWTMSV